MTGFEAYVLYVAIKQHFTSKSYDYFKYEGKVRVDETNYEVRKDRYHFYKLSRQRDPRLLLVSNFAEGNVKWVGDLLTDEAKSVYNAWEAYNASVKFQFSKDCALVIPDLATNCKVIDGQHPPLLKLVLQKEVRLQSLYIMNDLLGFFPNWDSKIEDGIIWPKLRTRCLKAGPFLEYDRQMAKKAIVDAG